MSGDAAEPADAGRPQAPRIEWDRLRARLASGWWLAAAALIAWVTWPYPSIEATAGLDPSWQIALHLAAADRLDSGRDLVFSYGPLGFLSQPLLVTTATAVASLVFAIAMQLVLCTLVLRSALRSFPAWIAVLLTYAVGAMLAATGFSNLGDYAVLVVFLLAVHALEDATPPVWLVPVGALLAAFQLLVKVNGGIVCLVLLALVVWRCRPGGWRSEALLAGTFTVALLVLWVASGSSLGALPSWIRWEFHIVTSYTDAMALEAVDSGEYVEAALLTLVAAAAVLARIRTLGRRRGLILAATSGVYAFAYFKEGFIRHDPIHSTLFFSALAIGLLAFTWDAQIRWVAATVVVASLGAVAASVGSSAFVYRPVDRARFAVRETRSILDGSRRRRVLADSRAATRAKLGIDTASLNMLKGHTVDVEPSETSAIWAYDLKWRPQPLIQSYLAVDHALDRFNGRGLTQHGAERILRGREQFAIDDKHPAYLAPESYLVLVCRYRQLRVSGDWEVLGRANDRCGESRPLGSVSARAGEAVPVPAAPGPRYVVYARIQINKTLKQRLASLALKPVHTPKISVGSETYRLVADTARGPLIMRMPRTAGIAPGFGGELDYSRLVLHNVASPYRVTFFAMSLAGR